MVRMPSLVLNGEIPHCVLFPTKPLFPIAPRIFGCVCFTWDVRPHHTKLDPKSLKCIFLSYLRVQKGYCCYSPTLNKYLVSPDVTFFEDIPFSPLPSSHCQGEDDDILPMRLTFPHHLLLRLLCLFLLAHLVLESTLGSLHNNLQTHVLHQWLL